MIKQKSCVCETFIEKQNFMRISNGNLSITRFCNKEVINFHDMIILLFSIVYLNSSNELLRNVNQVPILHHHVNDKSTCNPVRHNYMILNVNWLK